MKCRITNVRAVLNDIIVFPSLHLDKNASLMIRNDVFTGTVSASTPLSTQLRFVFVINLNFKFITNTNPN